MSAAAKGPSPRPCPGALQAAGVLVLAAVLLGACGRGGTAGQAPPEPSPPVHTVEGIITEFEGDSLSVRLTDRRQLIFDIGGMDADRALLRERLDSLTPIRVTYQRVRGRLEPSAIEEACPREDPGCLKEFFPPPTPI